MRAANRWFSGHLQNSLARTVDAICQPIHQEFFNLSHENPTTDKFTLLESPLYSSTADHCITCQPWPVQKALETCEYNNRGTCIQLAPVVIVPQSELQHADIGYEPCPRLHRRLKGQITGNFGEHSFPCFLMIDFGLGKNVEEFAFNLDVRLAISRYVYSL
jgi:hypothetical protein